jgi:hypothetical protein
MKVAPVRLALICLSAGVVVAFPVGADQSPSGHATKSLFPAGAEIHSVLAHPVFSSPYACMEHGKDSLQWDLGDALGTDCFIAATIEVNGPTWPRFYKGSGSENQDWYSWQQDVLSPCTCDVVEIHLNPVTNRPGVMGKERASAIRLKRPDGVVFMVVHIDEPRVRVGEAVTEGQVLAQVGNNGLSNHPHIHIGAFKGSEPLQIRFNQRFIQ